MICHNWVFRKEVNLRLCSHTNPIGFSIGMYNLARLFTFFDIGCILVDIGYLSVHDHVSYFYF